jgi:hypothetical protein
MLSVLPVEIMMDILYKHKGLLHPVARIMKDRFVKDIDYLLQIVDKEYLHPVPGSTMANYCIELSYCCTPWYIVGDTETAVFNEYEKLNIGNDDDTGCTLYHGDLIVSDSSRQLISIGLFEEFTWLEMIGIETEPKLSIDQVKIWVKEQYGCNIVKNRTIGKMITAGTFTDRDGRKRAITRITIP